MVGQTDQKSTQGIDKRIEYLVRHRFLEITAPVEYHGFSPRGIPFNPAQKMLHKRAFAHAGTPSDPDRHRVIAPPFESLIEGSQGRLAAHEEAFPGRRTRNARCRAPLSRDTVGSVHGEQGLNPLHVEPRGAVPPQQAAAKLGKVVGNVRYALLDVDRILGLLTTEHFHQRSRKRRVPRERLIEHHPDAIPIGRGRGRCPESLLRGHVDRRAHELGGVGIEQCRVRAELRDQSEIEQHEPAFGSHQDVRRFDITVQLAVIMEVLQPRGELREQVAYLVIILRRVPVDSRKTPPSTGVLPSSLAPSFPILALPIPIPGQPDRSSSK